mmetsp:Transcript_5886/g.11652  ORF Transcript_5886/g.11652 Transcript_5886/m.11652 type:complete len:467 (-) Transcript_5886:35-1435(-)|eukprot:CAMPEP_0181314236 /NCGR_PEP_ID=MMETSP1101-20121128/14701_1 /TAXON_ID=46948 /ORGANISM="Rhodomonas abbreviata, Strain Caron Lab Isolate" /LENGTH=466 /DNA_ID=CAMNT_0023421297 /DNA_START=35 /DNA_END=1435 /DNA_ORIENTATION=+
MKLFAALAVLAAAAVSTATASDVQVLGDATLSDFVKSNEFVLVEFYAPWCGHCKQLAPEYEKAATALKDFEPKVVLAKVDATEEKAVAEEFGVSGFPTLKWFVNGEPMEYSGGRDEATIVSWIKKKTGPATTSVSSQAEIDAAKEANDVIAVGVFADADAMKAFEAAAMLEEDVPYFSAVGVADLAEGITVYKTFDEPTVAYEGDATDASAIGAFVAGESLPLVVPFNQQTAQKIFGGDIQQQLLAFFDEDDADLKASIEAALKEVAKEQKGTMLFVTIAATDERVLEFFGLDAAKDLPTTRIVKLGDGAMKKYADPNAAEITAESTRAFVKAFQAGEIAPDLKSEEIPASQDEDVVVLVGKSFDSIVNEPGKHVFVEFYAPWCGHCKKLAPIYDELAAAFKGNDDVVIAKMDSTANEVEAVSVSGFPTLKMSLADSDEFIDYDGARELAAMKEWIEAKTGVTATA